MKICYKCKSIKNKIEFNKDNSRKDFLSIYCRSCDSVPLCSAKTPSKLIELCHYTNLQPLWAQENLSKNGKY